jgi:hypothetical protein
MELGNGVRAILAGVVALAGLVGALEFATARAMM